MCGFAFGEHQCSPPAEDVHFLPEEEPASKWKQEVAEPSLERIKTKNPEAGVERLTRACSSESPLSPTFQCWRVGLPMRIHADGNSAASNIEMGGNGGNPHMGHVRQYAGALKRYAFAKRDSHYFPLSMDSKK